ncbi:hypothetical protein ENKNEFLB_02813 [Nocardioides aquaticus]|uniref:Secreted protein n=1 Tax=Nocardioides aquaticus TaxID=160826 RepID=A0ABX8EP29_9ACTN|nr:hypothetical protein [Nocardioides aquaticus]QVT80418.1 hypothetical protein ENKNEFLB_02813 [Nocardioides aquaticus]
MATAMRALILGASSALVLGLAPPTSAADATRTDPRGDAAAKYDLLSGKYVNSAQAFSVNAKVANLQNVTTQVRVSFATPAMKRRNSQFEVYAKRARGGARTKVLYSRSGGTWDRLNCSGLRATWKLDQDRFVVRVPQACLGEGVGKQTAYTSIGLPNREFADTLTRTVVRYR